MFSNMGAIASDMRTRTPDRREPKQGPRVPPRSNVNSMCPIPPNKNKSCPFPSGATLGKYAEMATGARPPSACEPTSSLLSLLQLLPVAWPALALQLHGLYYAL